MKIPWFSAGPKEPSTPSSPPPPDEMTLEAHEDVVASLQGFGKEGKPSDEEAEREVEEKQKLLARLRSETEEKKRQLAELERERNAAQQRIAELEAELARTRKQ